MTNRCLGITKKGTKCIRKIRHKQYCHMHHPRLTRSLARQHPGVHREDSLNSEQCCVCFKSIRERLLCDHVVCYNCINNMKKYNLNQCPICRSELWPKRPRYIFLVGFLITFGELNMIILQ